MKLAYLSGGVGGARLLDGLAKLVAPDSLTTIVNVGDDFDHLQLRICPDLDTVLYTLSGFADTRRGWGLRKDTFHALEWIERYGGEHWFALGDTDLATHLMRTHWLSQGHTLTEVSRRIARALGVAHEVLPMSDDRLETQIDTEHDGTLAFQEWLVRRRAEPVVKRVWFQGNASASSAVLEALERADAVIIGPSNPYVSIDPILSLAGVRERLAERPVIAVSPIVLGKALKGPLGGMLESLARVPASAGAVAAHYGGLLRGFVVEQGDHHGIAGLPCLPAQTIMRTPEQRIALAQRVLAFAESLCGAHT